MLRFSTLLTDDTLDFEAKRENLRGLVQNSQKLFGLTWEELAAEANLAYATVRNLGDGTTMHPRLETGLALVGVFIRFQAVYHRNAPGASVAPVVVQIASIPAQQPARRSRLNRLKPPEPIWRQRQAKRRKRKFGMRA